MKLFSFLIVINFGFISNVLSCPKLDGTYKCDGYVKSQTLEIKMEEKNGQPLFHFIRTDDDDPSIEIKNSFLADGQLHAEKSVVKHTTCNSEKQLMMQSTGYYGNIAIMYNETITALDGGDFESVVHNYFFDSGVKTKEVTATTICRIF